MTDRTVRAPRAAAPAAVREPNRLWRLAFGFALAVQLIVLYSPYGVGGPGITGLDKVVHVVVFFAPAFALLMMGIRARWALGILALQALISELIQGFGLAQRDGDAFDVMADLGGVALAGLAYLVWSRRQH